MGNEFSQPVTRGRNRWRVLRPMFWWLLLFLTLFGLRKHAEWMEKTRIQFWAKVENCRYDNFPEAMVDGQFVQSGQKISLGRHTFSVTHQKGISFTTNFFCWYGGVSFPEIKLPRKMGFLVVTAVPPATVLQIRGPDFSLFLHNFSTTNLNLPADGYDVIAGYPHWKHTNQLTVDSDLTSRCTFAPELGALTLTANRDETYYRLLSEKGDAVEAGSIPAEIPGLPAGPYVVKSTYHEFETSQKVSVFSNATNAVPVHFALGAVELDSTPSGAEVRTATGLLLGRTPLRVLDLLPQTNEFRLTLNAYEPALIAVPVTDSETNRCQTSLVNSRYLAAIRDARAYLSVKSYSAVVTAANEALAVKPNDAEALVLLTQASERLEADRQKQLAEQQQREAELERVKQVSRPREAFTTLGNANPDSLYFKEYEIKTSKPAKELAEAIVKSLTAAPEAYTILENSSPQPKTYEIRATYGYSMSLLGGMAQTCLIVVGQTKDGETQLLYKVVPYESKHADIGGVLSNYKDDLQYALATPARMQGNDLLRLRVDHEYQRFAARMKAALDAVP